MRAGALLIGILLSVAAPAHAQAPAGAASSGPSSPQPVTGFVSPYEIVRTVRAAGFDPLAPPLREGTSYVLRAMDFRGILLRVVVDARTGVIRDVNRIVPGPGRYGQFGIMPTPYGILPPAYGMPSAYDSDMYDPRFPTPDEDDMAPPPPPPPPSLRPTPSRMAPPPPLPRPRPAALASRKPVAEAGVGALPGGAIPAPNSPAGTAHSEAAPSPAAAPASAKSPAEPIND